MFLCRRADGAEELRVCDVMSRSLGWTGKATDELSTFNDPAFMLCPQPGSPLELDENDVAEILAELYGEEPIFWQLSKHC